SYRFAGRRGNSAGAAGRGAYCIHNAREGGAAVSDPLVRFTVSLEADLLESFDRYIAEQKVATRSEAIRQLIREALTAHDWAAGAAAATLTIVYDHHRPSLMEKLLALQHRHAHLVVSTMHVHLDGDHCLEVIALRGPAAELGRMAAELKGLKGIHQGQLVLARTSTTTITTSTHERAPAVARDRHRQLVVPRLVRPILRRGAPTSRALRRRRPRGGRARRRPPGSAGPAAGRRRADHRRRDAARG